jgi:hypothetical protein
MASDDRGDRPKKSWREIDAQRDRSGGQRSGERDGRAKPGLPERSSKQYRAALEALFDKGEVGKLAQKLQAPGGKAEPAKPRIAAPAADEGRASLRKKIVEAIGRDEITRAADRYLRELPPPEDYEVLEQLLEHRKEERIAEALALIEKLLEREKPKRTRVLVAKLRLLEETSTDREIRQAAARLRARLG